MRPNWESEARDSLIVQTSAASMRATGTRGMNIWALDEPCGFRRKMEVDRPFGMYFVLEVYMDEFETSKRTTSESFRRGAICHFDVRNCPVFLKARWLFFKRRICNDAAVPGGREQDAWFNTKLYSRSGADPNVAMDSKTVQKLFAASIKASGVTNPKKTHICTLRYSWSFPPFTLLLFYIFFSHLSNC